MAGNGSRSGSGRSGGGVMTAAAKRLSIYRAASARREQIRQSSPASMALKNKALTRQDQSRLDRTKEGRRSNFVARMEAFRSMESGIGSGRGSRAVRRAKQLGVSPAGQRRIRRMAQAA